MIKLEILTHSGEPEQVETELYEPTALNQLINDPTTLTVLIGQNIYSRVDIKGVKVIKEVANEPTVEKTVAETNEEPIE